jgi:hypothetical protein
MLIFATCRPGIHCPAPFIADAVYFATCRPGIHCPAPFIADAVHAGE